MNATDRLRELQEQRDAAGARVGQLEDEHRRAVAAQQEASAALAEAERVGVSATKRHALEQALAEAKARADEPWSERLEGARGAVRDADHALRDHVAAHLDELVTALEREGEAAAQAVDEAAANLFTAQLERDRIAAALGSLITRVSRPGPMDVSRSRADELARSAAAFAAAGGEDPPRLDRTRPPWSELLAQHEPALA
jgi:chromosome segregation ATPase